MKFKYQLIIFSVSVLPLVLNFNCKIQPDTYTCLNNTICNENGICVCPQFYYGNNCEKILPDSNFLNIYTTGVSLTGYIGIIVGLILGFSVLLIIGLLIIYYLLKDRDY